jgi:CRISPR-associated protein Csb2
MKPALCITFRFIQPFPLFHGSGDAGVPEWPPSPMRAFQALVNATSLRYRGRLLPPEVESALTLIETIRPSILAPNAQPSTVGYRAYVPHNQTDLVTAAWDRGSNNASIASHRMEKDIRPIRITASAEAMPILHYLYPLDASVTECERLLSVIRPCVRSISSLGWGIDQVVADAILLTETQAPDSSGYRWQPADQGRHRLRVHRKGSLHALRQRHERFLTRLVNGKFTPVPPITALDVVRYAHEADPLPRPHAVFKLLNPNEDPAPYPQSKLIHIAGMVRHLAIGAMTDAGADADFVNRVVRGKREPSAGDDHKQFSYVPLPSIGHEHADGIIRNVMLVAPIGMERELIDLADRIDGQPLKPEGEFGECKSDLTLTEVYRAELRLFTPPANKFIDTHYLGTSRIWQTVTPVILDGHNKKSKTDKPDAIARETEKLICKALQRAGIETPCKFTWQAIAFLKNCFSAHKYDRNGRHTGYHRPTHLKDLTAVHVQLTFDHPIPGPITIGAGRHCGLGTFTAVNEGKS